MSWVCERGGDLVNKNGLLFFLTFAGINDELLEFIEDSRGPPENFEKVSRGLEEFYGTEHEKKYEDCIDIDYSDQF